MITVQFSILRKKYSNVYIAFGKIDNHSNLIYECYSRTSGSKELLYVNTAEMINRYFEVKSYLQLLNMGVATLGIQRYTQNLCTP